MKELGPRVRVIKATPLKDFIMAIEFDNGEKRDIDLQPYLKGPIFKHVREDPAVFRNVLIRGGTLAWENGADIDPDVLYYNLQPAWQAQPESG